MKLLIWCPAQLCGMESWHAILILSLSGVNIDIMLTDAVTTFLGDFLVMEQICCVSISQSRGWYWKDWLLKLNYVFFFICCDVNLIWARENDSLLSYYGNSKLVSFGFLLASFLHYQTHKIIYVSIYRLTCGFYWLIFNDPTVVISIYCMSILYYRPLRGYIYPDIN